MDKKKQPNKVKPKGGERLSFLDIKKLMHHDSYRRINGAIRRIR